MGKCLNTNSVRVCTHGAHLCDQKGGLRSPFFVERQHVCQGELADDVTAQRNKGPMFIACPRCFDKHLQRVGQLMISAMAGGIHGAAARPSIIDVQHVALAHLLRTKKGSPVPSSRMSRARPRGPAVPIGSSSYSGAMPPPSARDGRHGASSGVWEEHGLPQVRQLLDISRYETSMGRPPGPA